MRLLPLVFVLLVACSAPPKPTPSQRPIAPYVAKIADALCQKDAKSLRALSSPEFQQELGDIEGYFGSDPYTCKGWSYFGGIDNGPLGYDVFFITLDTDGQNTPWIVYGDPQTKLVMKME